MLTVYKSDGNHSINRIYPVGFSQYNFLILATIFNEEERYMQSKVLKRTSSVVCHFIWDLNWKSTSNSS